MALSPNYNWSEPDNSSLVKDGAQAMRTLGDAIDTSVWNVGFGQAGKNKIINGDFKINQRNFTSNTTSNVFNFDRWLQNNSGGTVTCTPQTFTPGAAPVAGYEGSTFLRTDVTGQSAAGDRAEVRQRIESVRTFAGQTVTVSFWAKAASGTPSVTIELLQNFGSGGSPSSEVQGIGSVKQAITTSWARYSATISVPGISGKTLGTTNDGYLLLNIWLSAGSNNNSRSNTLGTQTNTFDIWGCQAEAGSTATPFQTASGGSIQSELAMCQRYYYRTTAGTDRIFGNGMPYNTTNSLISIAFPVPLRIRPTALEQTGTAANYKTLRANAAAFDNLTSVPTYDAGTNISLGIVTTTSSNLVAGNAVFLFSNDAAAYLGWSAEL
jgi:hypothetical protein